MKHMYFHVFVSYNLYIHGLCVCVYFEPLIL